MDPVAAFALACNVLQVVDTSIKVAKICKEIYQKGSLSEHDEILTVAKDLSATNAELGTTLSKAKFSSAQLKLQKACENSRTTADELIKIVNEINFHNKQSRGRAFVQALRILAKRRPIEKLEQKLKEQDQLLNSIILKELYQRCEASDILQSASYDSLKKIQKDLVRQHFELQARLNTSHAAVTKQVHSSEANVISHFNSLSINARTAQAYQNFVDSFYFSEIVSRQVMIQERISDYSITYSWLFLPPPADTKRLDPGFYSWLQKQRDQQRGLFWVTGKPGSGKSSLMNYVYENLQEGEAGDPILEDWAPPTKRIVLRHFFYQPASTDLLKSLEGLLRTMCYQSLTEEPDLQALLSKDLLLPAPVKSRMTHALKSSPWLLNDLRQCFEYILSKVASFKTIFMLVDGLDEMNGDQEDAAIYLQTLDNTFPGLKICCSSRPEVHFTEIFRTEASLRLQNFNQPDMEDYCRRKLANTKAAVLGDRIVEMAEGVFLWLYIVVEHLRQAARYSDERELRQILEDCPGDMLKLFSHMLHKAEHLSFRSTSDSYLAIAYFASMSAFGSDLPCTATFIIADKFDTELDRGIFVPQMNITLAQTIIEQCADGQRRVHALSCGMVEPRKSEHSTTWIEVYVNHISVLWRNSSDNGVKIRDDDHRIPKSYILACLTTWSFIHKTVKDYLEESHGSEQTPVIFRSSDLAIRTRILRANLAILRIVFTLIPRTVLIDAFGKHIEFCIGCLGTFFGYLKDEIAAYLNLGLGIPVIAKWIETGFDIISQYFWAFTSINTKLRAIGSDLRADACLLWFVLDSWLPYGPPTELQLRASAARYPKLINYVDAQFDKAPTGYHNQLALLAIIQALKNDVHHNCSEVYGTVIHFLEQIDNLEEQIQLAHSPTGNNTSFPYHIRVKTTIGKTVLASLFVYGCPLGRLTDEDSDRPDCSDVIRCLMAKGVAPVVDIDLGMVEQWKFPDEDELFAAGDEGFELFRSHELEANDRPDFMVFVYIKCFIPDLLAFNEVLKAGSAASNLQQVITFHTKKLSVGDTDIVITPSFDEVEMLSRHLTQAILLRTELMSETRIEEERQVRCDTLDADLQASKIESDLRSLWEKDCTNRDEGRDLVVTMFQRRKHDFTAAEICELEGLYEATAGGKLFDD